MRVTNKQELLEWVLSLPDDTLVDRFEGEIAMPQSGDTPSNRDMMLYKNTSAVHRIRVSMDASYREVFD